MRVVVQRVRGAQVRVHGHSIGTIGLGLVVLIAVGKNDTKDDAVWMARKVAGLRVFANHDQKMTQSVQEVGGSLLVISQFTLYGDVARGYRPNFSQSAPPMDARVLYEEFVAQLKDSGVLVETGQFGADMDLELINWGPVTVIIDSPTESAT